MPSGTTARLYLGLKNEEIAYIIVSWTCEKAPVIRSSPFDVGALLNACIIIIIISIKH